MAERRASSRTAVVEASEAAASAAAKKAAKAKAKASTSAKRDKKGAADEPAAAASTSRRGGSFFSIDSLLRKTHRAKLATRPVYSSEEDEDEAAEADAEDASSPAATPALVSSSGYRFAQRRRSQTRGSLTERLFARPPPAIKQWQVNLALARGPLASKPSRNGWQYIATSDGEAGGGGAEFDLDGTALLGGGADEHKQQQVAVKLETSPEAAAEASKNRPHVPSSYSRPFDMRRPPDAPAAANSADAAAPPRYWIYPSGQVKRLKGDHGYSVTDHSWYHDGAVLRASPSLTPAELSAITGVAPGDACRHNGLTFIRNMRVKVKDETRTELKRVMKTVTGEIDRKVLSMCENGNMSKCKVYKTDDFNYTLITTESVLSGEPLGAWMGTLREKNTFAQRVGFETSLTHIWAYEITAAELPAGYTGPDLVVDASQYGNESHFFRDPKWSHQQADANVTCRLVWNQPAGLPYLVFVALCDIAPNAELFLDWGDKCWKIVWNTQLTALATNSHLAHVYLKSLQTLCADVGIHVLPQLAGSKFSAEPRHEDDEKDEQRRFLDEELRPFATTSTTTLRGAGKKSGEQADAPPAASPSSTSTTPTQDGLIIDATMDTSAIDTPAAASSSSAASSATSSAAASFASPSLDDDLPMLGGPASSSSAAASSSSALTKRRAALDLKIQTRPPPPAADESDKDSDSSALSSAPSSPYTPSFNTHKAFCATTSHTMLTVFASALLCENLREVERIKRRLMRHRIARFRRVKAEKKEMLQDTHGAIHVHGPHSFELVEDVQQAFFKSGTRLGREAKVAVSTDTIRYVAEAFDLLRPIDKPLPRDSKLIREGTVPKSAVYEVVGLKHPARFFTRPDQTPFSLVATEKYNKEEPIGAYIGVFRDFHQFHKASDTDAMKQVFAYDCHAQQIPGPPNPFLSAKDRAKPRDEQLAYRGGDLIVESLYYGNEIRFMNDCYGRAGHDATVNAYATIAWDTERGWPCILIRALRPIPKGDEIICDYGDNFWNKVARSLMMDHASYGDEVKHLIEHTEQWILSNGLELPKRPTERSQLPSLFTTDIQRDLVTYPLHFLQPFELDVDGALTEEQALAALEEGRTNVTGYHAHMQMIAEKQAERLAASQRDQTARAAFRQQQIDAEVYNSPVAKAESDLDHTTSEAEEDDLKPLPAAAAAAAKTRPTRGLKRSAATVAPAPTSVASGVSSSVAASPTRKRTKTEVKTKATKKKSLAASSTALALALAPALAPSSAVAIAANVKIEGVDVISIMPLADENSSSSVTTPRLLLSSPRRRSKQAPNSSSSSRRR